MTDQPPRIGPVSALGLSPNMKILEVNSDTDSDEVLRQNIEFIARKNDSDESESVDVVLLWWRKNDGDLNDALFGVLRDLAAGGSVWLLTLKPGRHGHIDAFEITEAASELNLRQTKTVMIGSDWRATQLES